MQSGLKKGMVSAIVIEAIVATAIISLVIIISGCGGGGGGNPPVYSDDGVCLASCPSDVINNDITPSEEGKPDTYNPSCPAVMPAICGMDMTAKCVEDHFDKNKKCEGHNFNFGKPCSTDEECQILPTRQELLDATAKSHCIEKEGGPGICDDGINKGMGCLWNDEECQKIPSEFLDNPYYPMPPCECWDVLPCTLAAWVWDCKIWKESFAIYLWPQDQSCIIDGGQGNIVVFFKQGMDHAQKPLEGDFEEKITLLDNGYQYRLDIPVNYTLTCTRIVL